MRKKGYLLIEGLIAIFVFSVLVVVLSVFLKEIVIIENYKKNSYRSDETVNIILDKVIKDIKERDKAKFYYRGDKKNIHLNGESIVYKKDKIIYKLDIINNGIYISDGKKASELGKRSNLSRYSEINWELIDDLLIINVVENGKTIQKVLNVKK